MPAVLASEDSRAVIASNPKPIHEEKRVSLLTLCGLALVIGVMTGLGAVAFRALIAFVHNAFYNGRLSLL